MEQDDAEFYTNFMDKRFENGLKMEEQGRSEVVKYFDRINDKFFDINNILIAAYLALVALIPEISKLLILIPFSNLVILIYVEYRMMEINRLQSKTNTLTKLEIFRYDTMMMKTNTFAFVTIVTTLITILVLIIVIFNYKSNLTT